MATDGTERIGGETPVRSRPLIEKRSHAPNP